MYESLFAEGPDNGLIVPLISGTKSGMKLPAGNDKISGIR